ncbi:MAG: M23 family metallopeptidase [Chloroflexia bacterium]|nr:M23 family metallopeptidase [Chloroflexia bacterium]
MSCRYLFGTTSVLVLGFLALGGLLLSSCGCASPGRSRSPLLPGAATLPTGFALASPWDLGERHRIIRAYDVSTHTGVNRPLRTNDAYALDFDLAAGDAVLPVAPGRVRFAGEARGGFATYGLIVLLDHAQGISSLYAHLDSVAVERGAVVSLETILGRSGSSGGVRPHLHLALYRGVRLANNPMSAGPYGGVSVLPEPLGAQRGVGLMRDQCVESVQPRRVFDRRWHIARV